MNIVFFGNGPRGVRCLETLREHEYTISAVIGHSERSDVVAAGKQFGIPTSHPEKVNAPTFVAHIQALAPDLMVLAGYNQILRKNLIDLPRHGTLNLHGGKLPEYKGVAPINWQIIKGETTGGCAIIFVDEGIDTGDIVEQAVYDIGENDTAGDIVNRQLELFPPMLVRAIQAIQAGAIQRQTQNPHDGAYYTRRYPRDSRVNWTTMTAREAHDLIRAMQGPSYPPAFACYQNRTYYFHESRLLPETIMGTPGRIALKRKNGVIVLAKDRGLLLTQIAFENEEPRNPRTVLDTGEDFE